MAQVAKVEHEVYQRPVVDGVETEHVLHEEDWRGRTTFRRVDNLGKLYKANADGERKITAKQYTAGLDFLRMVSDFYAMTSPFARVSEETPMACSGGDPINRYIKARPIREGKGYVSTQRPRNVVRVKSSFDGWTGAKLQTLTRMNRLQHVLKAIPAEARRALCHLVINPGNPAMPAMALTRYTRIRAGYQNAKSDQETVRLLAVALDHLHAEYGEMDQEAA